MRTTKNGFFLKVNKKVEEALCHFDAKCMYQVMPQATVIVLVGKNYHFCVSVCVEDSKKNTVVKGSA